MAKPTDPHRGAGLFGDHEPEGKPAVPAAWRANIDGGSRGNPGPAAYGVVIRNPRGEIVARLRKYIGRATNNVAEYYGLIAALDYAQSNSVRALHIESDSELLVKQMRGEYKVRNAGLHHRRGVLWRQCAQGEGWRLGATRHRAHDLHSHDDVAAWATDRARTPRRRVDTA